MDDIQQKKRIALISPAFPLRGGIAASSERLAQTLIAEGHNVEIFSFSLQYPGFLFPGKSQYSSDPPPAGLTIHTCINSINPINWIISGRKIALFEPDVIVTRFWLPFMGPCLGTILRIVRYFSKKKVVIGGLIDNIIPHEKRIGDRFFAQYFAKACDQFTVMSSSVLEEIKVFSAEKPVRYAPHPVYDIYGEKVEKRAARAALGLPLDQPLVLFFGMIREYKGLDLLLDALAEEPCVAANIGAVIAGEVYGDWTPYADQIFAHHLSERVFLNLEFIATERVNLYFSAADLVVQPYKSATQSGISQIAYHFELPMVVTNVGGLPEIVIDGESGYVVPPTASAVAAAIADFFKNNRAGKLSIGVASLKKRYSWENLTRALLQ